MLEPAVDAVVRLVRDVIGQDLVGVVLHGSAVMGGLRPTSDLDVLAVTRRSLDAERRGRLGVGLRDVSGRRARRGPARPVELTVVVDSEIRPWRYPPTMDFQYGEWLRDELEAGLPPAAGPNPDLAPVLAVARTRGVALLGPPPAELLDAVPPDDLRRAVAAGVPGLLADLEGDTRNVLLTLARVWLTVQTGDIRTKDEAAAWAMTRLPGDSAAVVGRAREMYLGEVDEDDDPAVAWAGWTEAVRSAADRMVEAITGASR